MPPRDQFLANTHRARGAPSIAFALAIALGTETARANAPEASSGPEPLTWSYLYDGGAIPFVWGAGALYVSLLVWAEPPDTPLFFSADEGGAEPKGDSISDYTLGLDGGAAALAIAVGGDESRWFHLKGYFEAWLTTAAVTRIAKVTFGRHRPDFDLEGENATSERTSFFSGHASATLAQATYLALYLRYHVFDRVRGERALPWWEAATYLGLATAAAYVPYSRVADHRHHVSDVVVGSLVGAAASSAFFYWQERRYRRALYPEGPSREKPGRAVLLPEIDHPGLALTVRW